MVLAILLALTTVLFGSTPVSAADHQTVLDSLAVRDEVTTGYVRSDWYHWDYGITWGDGCDVRCEILARDKRSNGTWYSPYDGYVSSDPSTFDVDHFVSLEEAHQSGGYAWTYDQRKAYANNLEDATLILVSSTSNQSKGSKEPQNWLPSRAATDLSVACWYVTTWIDVKAEWGLSVDATEKTALTNLLSTNCDPPPACDLPTPSTQFASFVASDPTKAQVWRLYSAYFLRQPDLDGFNYWLGIRQSTSHENVSGYFEASEEFNIMYGSLSDRDYVTVVYSNVLCRTPDAAGYTYWTGLLANHTIDRGTMMLLFSESDEYLARTGTSYPLR